MSQAGHPIEGSGFQRGVASGDDPSRLQFADDKKSDVGVQFRRLNRLDVGDGPLIGMVRFVLPGTVNGFGCSMVRRTCK